MACLPLSIWKPLVVDGSRISQDKYKIILVSPWRGRVHQTGYWLVRFMWCISRLWLWLSSENVDFDVEEEHVWIYKIAIIPYVGHSVSATITRHRSRLECFNSLFDFLRNLYPAFTSLPDQHVGGYLVHMSTKIFISYRLRVEYPDERMHNDLVEAWRFFVTISVTFSRLLLPYNSIEGNTGAERPQLNVSVVCGIVAFGNFG